MSSAIPLAPWGRPASRLRAVLVGVACCVPCSEAVAQSVSPRVAALIYGEDERRDLYEVAAGDPGRELALQTTLALLPSEALQPAAAGGVDVTGERLGDLYRLCPSEEFRDQTAVGLCSGVLIDGALVLTAGHCATRAFCADQRWVFGYALRSPSSAAVVRTEDVYRCREVVLAVDTDLDGQRHDYAFIELDRPVSAQRRVASLRHTPLSDGEDVQVIGYPHGLPVKLAPGARVLDARDVARDFFTLSSDTFDGNSGSGVFDRAGRLIGVFVRGGRDYDYRAEEECFAARRVEHDVGSIGGEQASYLGLALDALCARNAARPVCARRAFTPVQWSCTAAVPGSHADETRHWPALLPLLGWIVRRRQNTAR